MSERLQKFLANAGYGSRRQIESWIEAGRIEVDGRRAVLGQQVTGAERIVVDGRPVDAQAAAAREPEVIAYHKPVGEVCSRSDPEGRPTVYDNLPPPAHGRWIGIGRLDLNTSGLILFTNDGELANRLMHPSQVVDREYAVRVLGEVSTETLEALRRGVQLDDGPARFTDIQEAGGRGANHWYHVVIQEGRKREVRRLWESQGVQVSRLMRVRYGPILLDKKLRPGRWRPLDAGDRAALYQAAGLPAPKAGPKSKPGSKHPAGRGKRRAPRHKRRQRK